MNIYTLKLKMLFTEYKAVRKAEIPGGITFSQLSLILDKIIGWEGRDEYAFLLNDRNIIISEEEVPELSAGHKFCQANTTFVSSLFLKGRDFVYAADDFFWRVEITEIDSRNTESAYYPQVLSSSGKCPADEIYSIEELNDFLEEYDYDECVYLKSYSRAKVNRLLKKEFIYTSGQPDISLKSELEESIVSGRGITYFFEEDYDEDSEPSFYEEINDLIDTISTSDIGMTMETMLDVLTKDELYDFAKASGLKKLSALRKSELINRICKYSLEKETVRKFLLSMNSIERNTLEKMVKANKEGQSIYKVDKTDGVSTLMNGHYLGMATFDRAVLAEEFVGIYDEISKEEGFLEKQEKYGYLKSCILTGLEYYGVMPKEIFEKLLKQNTSFYYTEEEIKEIMEYLPENVKNAYVVTDDAISLKELINEDGSVEDIWGNKPFYIPSEEEILIYGAGKCNYKGENIRLLAKALMKKGMNDSEAFQIAGGLATDINFGMPFGDVFRELTEFITIEEDELRYFLELMKNFYNHSRMIINRGHTPSELSAMERNKGSKRKKAK